MIYFLCACVCGTFRSGAVFPTEDAEKNTGKDTAKDTGKPGVLAMTLPSGKNTPHHGANNIS
jgi:hypothetical protein